MRSFYGFANRREAGRMLAAALTGFIGSGSLVLALPRGGVPVAFEVATALDAELDVLVVRKIGAPGHKELGIGAIVDGDAPELVIDQQLAEMVGATQEYIQMEIREQLVEIARRKLAYRGDRPDPAITGRTIILIDDGIATGGTMKAALKSLRRKHPARLVMAIPVASQDRLAEFSGLCDQIICLERPADFYAVGQFYADFTQTQDDEVIRLLNDVRTRHEARGAGSSPA